MAEAAMRAICLMVAALALSGCASSSYSQLIAKSRAEYEQTVLAGRAAPARRAAPRAYATRRMPRPAVTAADPRAAARASDTVGSVRQNPFPVGSPDWHAEWKRMDQDLEKRLRTICSAC